MAQLYALLIAALQLITLAQNQQLPVDLRDTALRIGNQAVDYVKVEMTKQPENPVVVQQVPQYIYVPYVPPQEPVMYSAPVPVVKKTISAYRTWQGTFYCSITAIYSENGNPQNGVTINISADDNGTFNFAGKGNVTSGFVDNVNKEGSFQYMPSTTGTRVVTLEANGVQTTVNCAGKQ